MSLNHNESIPLISQKNIVSYYDKSLTKEQIFINDENYLPVISQENLIYIPYYEDQVENRFFSSLEIITVIIYLILIVFIYIFGSIKTYNQHH